MTGRDDQRFNKDWQMNVARQARQCFPLLSSSALSPEKMTRLARHAAELLVWNRTFNITAITHPEEMAIKHYVDSMVLLPELPAGLRVLDLGAGGGFPGLPLKICRPDLSLTLVDSVRKKVGFMNHMIRTLSLTQTIALQARVESLPENPQYVNAFDRVVSRAFTGLGRFVELALPLLAPQGQVLALKGRLSRDELSQVDPQRYRVHHRTYTLPGDYERCLVSVSRR